MSKKKSLYIPLRPLQVPRKERIRRSQIPRKTIAVDWDGTLVDKDDTFLPGGLAALRQLSTSGNIIIHSCRCNYYEGALWIKSRLADEGISAEVWTGEGKPLADIYIDDRGLRFSNWEETLALLRDLDFIR